MPDWPGTGRPTPAPEPGDRLGTRVVQLSGDRCLVPAVLVAEPGHLILHEDTTAWWKPVREHRTMRPDPVAVQPVGGHLRICEIATPEYAAGVQDSFGALREIVRGSMPAPLDMTEIGRVEPHLGG